MSLETKALLRSIYFASLNSEDIDEVRLVISNMMDQEEVAYVESNYAKQEERKRRNIPNKA